MTPSHYDEERDIGGWLLLFALTQLAGWVLLLWQLPKTRAAFGGEIWALGASAGLFRPTVTFEAATQLLRVLAAPVGLVLLFRRSPRAPAFYGWFLALVLASAVIDALLVSGVHAQLHASLAAMGASTAGVASQRFIGLLGALRTAVYAGIWLAYWRRSDRVRRTFPRRGVRPAAR